MRVLVATIVHHPDDARISRRQIPALLHAGHQVTFLAPWSATGATPGENVTPVDVPRASDRRRLPAIQAARRLIGQHAGEADIVLLHDPELLIAVASLGDLPPTVWDVHEDTAAAVEDKSWIAGPLRPLARTGVRLFERSAERRLHLLLAEEGYASRFRHDHTVVPNAPAVPATVPPTRPDRVVYLGRLSERRGTHDLLDVARLLPEGVHLDLIGHADAQVRDDLQRAHDRGLVRWHRFVPNDQALRMVQGAAAGLSLLHDMPNYRHSLPTKILEYLANGVPVITTPNPHVSKIVHATNAGIEVPYRRPDLAADAVASLIRSTQRQAMADRGRRYVRKHFDWHRHGQDFVRQLESWATNPSPPRVGVET